MAVPFESAYLDLLRRGEFEARVNEAYAHIERCDLCGWECRINRCADQRGVCQTGELALVASYGPHLGEEDPIRGWRGSGTIFFARCNLRCQFCQNYNISQDEAGEPATPAELAYMMLELQHEGCHNINLVSPSHVIPQILAGVNIAAQNGLHLPLVFNTGGYDSLTSLQLLDGIIDIYMPDMKYAAQATGRLLSKVPRYPQVNQAAVREMHRQVGDLQIDEDGLAMRGLLVRHLVLPNDLAGTREIVTFLAQEIGPNTYLTRMDQYRPDYMVRRFPNKFPKLNRPITSKEYEIALQAALKVGLTRLDQHSDFFRF